MSDEFKRVRDGDHTEDVGAVQNFIYNRLANGQNGLEVGPYLEYVGAAGSAVKLPKIGAMLYVFNANAAVQTINFGDDTVASQALGAGGIALPPGQYTPLAAGANTHAIASDATVHIYIIKDDSRLTAKRT